MRRAGIAPAPHRRTRLGRVVSAGSTESSKRSSAHPHSRASVPVRLPGAPTFLERHTILTEENRASGYPRRVKVKDRVSLRERCYRHVATVAVLLFAAVISAQEYRTEKVPDCGIQFDAPSRLERLPMQLGSSAIYQRARLRQKDTADYVRAQYEWYCDVYTYSKKALKPEDIKLPAGVP